MRIALAQLNVVVGDLGGNRDKIVGALGEARAAGADLVLFPELAVTGYPPEDLLLRPGFLHAARESLEEVAAATTGLVALVGTPWLDRDLANACAVCADGEIRGVYRKQFLPNYGVFDEHRYFAEGRDLLLLRLGDALVGPTICEDVWQPGPPATDLALAGAQLLVNLSASPYHVGKAEEREEMLVTRARDTSSFFAFCNLVGGQDELVFDGHSVVLDDAGEVVARAPGFEEHLLVVDVEPTYAVGRRLRDVRRRELERSRESTPHVETIEVWARSSSATRPGRPTSPSSRPSSSRCGSRSRSGSATTWRRTGSRTSSSAPRAGSTRPSRRLSAWTRSAPSACTACRCRRATRRRARARTRARSPRTSAAASSRFRSRTSSPRSTMRSTSRPAASRGLPPRTSRRACAAFCSWRSRTRTAGSSSRPGTSPSSRSATRRSTATWSVGSRS